MKKFTLICLLVFLGIKQASTQTLGFLKQSGITNAGYSATGRGVATDAAGNIYQIGYFSGEINFGSYTLSSSGSGDIFIVKYDNAGTVLWAKRVGGGNNEFGMGIAVSGSSIYITGQFDGVIYFTPPGTDDNDPLISAGNGDIFIAKFDDAGNFQWARRAGTAFGVDFAYGVAASGSSVYITGYFSGTANFNTPSASGVNELTSVGNNDIFIAKYDDAGNFRWAKRAGGTGADVGYGIAVSGTSVYITGSVSGTADFNTPSASGVNEITSAGNGDIFIAKYDDAGNFQWAKRGGSTGSDFGYGIAVSGTAVYITGAFAGTFSTANFNTPSASGSNEIATAGSQDIFIAKYDAAGNFQWAKRAGGQSLEVAYSIAVLGTSLYIAGEIGGGTSNFNTPSAGGSNEINGVDYDMFVAKYNTNGNFQWAKRGGGAGIDFGYGIAVSGTSVYTSGYFNGTANFNTPSASGSNEITSLNRDAFFVEYIDNATCTPTSSITNTTVCPSALPYTWNGLTFTGTASQTVHLTNVAGCDSAATLNLTLLRSSGVLNLDGINDYISLPANSITSKIGTGRITVEAWINMKSYPYWATIIKNWGPGTGAFHFGLDGSSSKLSIYISQSNNTVKSIVSPFIISLNTWHHVAFSADGTTLSLYQDGELVGSIAYDGTLKTDFVHTFIGVKPNSTGTGASTSEQGYWDGGLEELRIWNTGRTQSEIQASMNSELVGNEAGLVSYYNFNATSGTVLKDKTSNSKDGTLTNFALTGNNSNWFSYALMNIVGASSVCNGSTIALSNDLGISGGVWSSLQSSASVNASGVVTGRANSGSATIEYNYTANGCNLAASKVIALNALPNMPSITYAAGTPNPQTGPGGAFCNNKTFTIIGNPSGGTWSSSNTGVLTVGSSSGIANTVGVGSATLTYTITNNGCSNSRGIAGTVANCASRGVNGQQSMVNSQWSLYPNPARTVISLNVNSLIGSGSIVVTDLYGKQIKQQVLSIGNNTIDVSRLAKGIYFVSVITEEVKKTEKIIVE